MGAVLDQILPRSPHRTQAANTLISCLQDLVRAVLSAGATPVVMWAAALEMGQTRKTNSAAGSSIPLEAPLHPTFLLAVEGPGPWNASGPSDEEGGRPCTGQVPPRRVQSPKDPPHPPAELGSPGLGRA